MSSEIVVEVYGKITDPMFQKARVSCEDYSKKNPNFKSKVVTMYPLEWDMFIQQKTKVFAPLLTEIRN
jgi:hypothetical protein